MTDRLGLLREGIRRPLPLAYHPLYRFYEGGSLTRTFRGLPERPDDWWSEDCQRACPSAYGQNGNKSASFAASGLARNDCQT